jgi:hypothetical protein
LIPVLDGNTRPQTFASRCGLDDYGTVYKVKSRT